MIEESGITQTTSDLIAAGVYTDDLPEVQRVAREISIIPLNHGFMVRIGCQSFAIESIDKLTSLLNRYLTNPAKTEESWLAGTLHI